MDAAIPNGAAIITVNNATIKIKLTIDNLSDNSIEGDVKNNNEKIIAIEKPVRKVTDIP